MRTTGTPCKKCEHGNKQGYEQPCCWCISNEDISFSMIKKDHPVNFVHFKEKEKKDE